MTIESVYEQYKHLDKLLSDETWLPGTIQARILFDLWSAVREAMKENPEEKIKEKIKITEDLTKAEILLLVKMYCDKSGYWFSDNYRFFKWLQKWLKGWK